jgi:flagellar basal body-associated protein FliL
MAAEVHIQEERYIFKPEPRRKLFIALLAGVVLFGLGLFLAMTSGGHKKALNMEKKEHASVAETNKMMASLQHEQEEATAADEHAQAGEHHESPTWLKRLYTTSVDE